MSSLVHGSCFLASRKYSRLNVRYSRLQQTPMMFTFSEGGGMEEEEDQEGDGDMEDKDITL